jgi:hypothetical protein
VTTSIASGGEWPVAAAENAIGHKPDISEQATPANRRNPVRNILRLLDDAVLLLLVVLLFPLAVLLVGTPVVLFVRLLIEIAQRL